MPFAVSSNDAVGDLLPEFSNPKNWGRCAPSRRSALGSVEALRAAHIDYTLFEHGQRPKTLVSIYFLNCGQEGIWILTISEYDSTIVARF